MTATAPQQDKPAEKSRRAIWQAAWINSLGRFLALVVVFLFFAFMVQGGKFYSPRNLENIARQSAVYAIAAIGMTLVIISGGIDLSIGSIIALTDVVLAWVLSWSAIGVASTGVGHADHLIEHWPLLLPIRGQCAISVIAATLAGFANGSLIVWLRLVPFIVTLGTMGIIRGLAKGIAGEKDIYPPQDTWINSIMDPTLTSHDAARSWMLLPPGIWLLIVSAGLAAILLRYTRLGRHIFAIGSNEDTARLCGVPVERTKILVYMLGRTVWRLGGRSAVFIYQRHRPADGRHFLRVVRDRRRGHRRRQPARRRRLDPRQLDRRIDHHDPLHGRPTDGLAQMGAGNRDRRYHHCRRRA